MFPGNLDKNIQFSGHCLNLKGLFTINAIFKSLQYYTHRITRMSSDPVGSTGMQIGSSYLVTGGFTFLAQ